MFAGTSALGQVQSTTINCFFGLSALIFTDIAVAQQRDRPDSLSQEQQQEFFQTLTDNERRRFFSMNPEEKRTFVQSKMGGIKAGPGSGQRTSRESAQTRRGPPSSVRTGPPSGARRAGFGGRPPTLVELGDVTREPLIKIVPITGRMISGQRGDIAARIKGSISRVRVKIGDRVTKGQLIAELDISRLKLEADLKAAEVLQARARWNSARAQVDLLNQELKRLERLRRSVAFSQARYDDKRQEVVKARSSVDETAAALRRAHASRELARIDLKDASIRAPYAGVVLNLHVFPGTFVNAGSRVISMLDDENLEVEADVPSDRLTALKPGSQVVLHINASTSFSATVRAIIPDENPLARTRAVRLIPQFDGNTQSLVPNQSVVINVPSSIGGRQVVAVAKDAIVNQQNGNFVFVFQNGRVRPARVEIGEAFANKFEIRSGLRPGMKVVVRGNELLRPGQPVRVAGAGNPGARSDGRPGDQPGGVIGRSSSKTLVRLPPEKRREFFQSLAPKDRKKFFAMDPDEKKKFISKRFGARGQ